MFSRFSSTKRTFRIGSQLIEIRLFPPPPFINVFHFACRHKYAQLTFEKVFFESRSHGTVDFQVFGVIGFFPRQLVNQLQKKIVNHVINTSFERSRRILINGYIIVPSNIIGSREFAESPGNYYPLPRNITNRRSVHGKIAHDAHVTLQNPTFTYANVFIATQQAPKPHDDSGVFARQGLCDIFSVFNEP